MLKQIIKQAVLKLHDTNSNHEWTFEIDFLKPQILVLKNGARKAIFNHVEHPTTDEFLMSLTKDLV